MTSSKFLTPRKLSLMTLVVLGAAYSASVLAQNSSNSYPDTPAYRIGGKGPTSTPVIRAYTPAPIVASPAAPEPRKVTSAPVVMPAPEPVPTYTPPVLKRKQARN